MKNIMYFACREPGMVFWNVKFAVFFGCKTSNNLKIFRDFLADMGA